MNGIEGVKAKRRQRVTETRATEQRDFIRGVSPPSPPLPRPLHPFISTAALPFYPSCRALRRFIYNAPLYALDDN